MWELVLFIGFIRVGRMSDLDIVKRPILIRLFVLLPTDNKVKGLLRGNISSINLPELNYTYKLEVG
ncbi:hypothetical protein FCM35_KLT00166 [Carex littledalei]|uniref:Uncharacterized protein n=1 Tax=Carex littledalei TaxID=544730 RepID=A0A833RVT4_9POAL|nr:hypothetical protein FCM35_KLT00166 [Carex littledalei]